MTQPVFPVPPGYRTVTPYLIVKGAAGLLTFIEKAFEGKIVRRMEKPDGTLGHCEVQIGDSLVMVSDATDQWTPLPGSLHLYVPDVDTWYQRALAAGAESIYEPTDMFYGDRSAGVKDASGCCWWLATHIEDVTPDEMARREAEAAGKSVH